MTPIDLSDTYLVMPWLVPLMQRALVVLVAGTIVAFGLAIARHFTRPAGVPPRMRALGAAGAAGGAIDLWVLARDPAASPAALLAALACAAASLWLFIAAVDATRARRLSVAFSADAPTHLETRGPYAYVRHPFYASYQLLWLAAAAGAAPPLPWVVALVMLAFYVTAARLEERKFAASTLAPAYADYRRRAGLFWPAPRHLLSLFLPARTAAGARPTPSREDPAR